MLGQLGRGRVGEGTARAAVQRPFHQRAEHAAHHRQYCHIHQHAAPEAEYVQIEHPGGADRHQNVDDGIVDAQLAEKAAGDVGGQRCQEAQQRAALPGHQHRAHRIQIQGQLQVINQLCQPHIDADSADHNQGANRADPKAGRTNRRRILFCFSCFHSSVPPPTRPGIIVNKIALSYHGGWELSNGEAQHFAPLLLFRGCIVVARVLDRRCSVLRVTTAEALMIER